MPSSKGEPTDPELREKVKEEVKNEEKGQCHAKFYEWSEVAMTDNSIQVVEKEAGRRGKPARCQSVTRLRAVIIKILVIIRTRPRRGRLRRRRISSRLMLIMMIA